MSKNNISHWQKLTDFMAILLIVISFVAVKSVNQPVRAPQQYMVYPAASRSPSRVEVCSLDLDQSGVVDEGDLSLAVDQDEETDFRVMILDHWGESCRH